MKAEEKDVNRKAEAILRQRCIRPAVSLEKNGSRG
jgi:hypothetical protein